MNLSWVSGGRGHNGPTPTPSRSLRYTVKNPFFIFWKFIRNLKKFKILDLQSLFHREIPTWKKCGHNMAPEYSGLNYCGFYGTYCLLYITVEIKFDFRITSTICAMVCKSFNNFQLYLRVFFWKPIRSTNKILTFKTRIKRCGKINVCFSSFNLLKQLLYLFWGCLASSSLNKAKKLNCAGLPG